MTTIELETFFQDSCYTMTLFFKEIVRRTLNNVGVSLKDEIDYLKNKRIL